MDAQTLPAAVCSLVPLYKHMNLSIALEPTADGTRYVVDVPFRDELASHVGTIHPAFQWAAGELLGGLIALHAFGGLDGLFLVVKEVNIKLGRPARSDLRATCAFTNANMEALKAGVANGEGNFSIAAQLTLKESGEEVATLTGDYMIRPRRPAAEGLT